MTFVEQIEAARIAAFASNATLNSRVEWIYWLNEVRDCLRCPGVCQFHCTFLLGKLLVRCARCYYVW